MAYITQKNNGSFLIRVYYGMKNGKLHQVSTTFKPKPGTISSVAKRDAEKYAVMFEELVHSGGYQKKKNATNEMRARHRTTLEDYIFQNYYPFIKKHLSPNTCKTYEIVIDSLILPSFGNIELEDITSTHLQQFVDFLSTPEARAECDTGLAPATVKRYATVFSSIISQAWKEQFIESNPFHGSFIRYPKIVQSEVEAYSDDEVEDFMCALKHEDLKTQALLTLAVSTGMRRAEMVGLMWSDIDFDKKEIRITRSAYKLKNEKQGLKSPKSLSSNRSAFMSDILIKTLRKWKIEQEKQKREAGGFWTDGGFVFTDNHGEMISVSTPTKICAKFEERHGLRHLKLHGLRHTCGSLMVEHGVDPETVKAVLGHESLRTTNRYIHPYEKSMREASEKMDRIMGGRKDDKAEKYQGSCQ